MVPEKQCGNCLEWKSVDAYYTNKASKFGRHSLCRSCQKASAKLRQVTNKTRILDYKLQKNFGISKEQYDEMLRRQGGVCAICHKPCKSGMRLAVDHCHDTGKVRGLLCGNCNVGLGNFRDNPILLRVAAQYVATR